MLKFTRKQMTSIGRPLSYRNIFVYTDAQNTNLAQLFTEQGSQLGNPVLSGPEGWISFYTIDANPLYYVPEGSKPVQPVSPELPVEGITLVGLTGLPITAGQPIASVGGFFIPADSTNVAHAGKVVGVAYKSTLVGEQSYVLSSGKVTNAGWNLPQTHVSIASGNRVIAGQDPLNVFNQILGVMYSPQTMIVQLSDAILA